MADLLARVALPVASEKDAIATARALGQVDEQVGTIHAVHVIEKAGGAVDKASVEQRELVAEEAFEALEAALDRPVETRITYGTDVTEAIFAVADDVDATAIVITPRGGSRWVRLLTGDVALSLITESVHPVVVLSDVQSRDADPDSPGANDGGAEGPGDGDENGDRA